MMTDHGKDASQRVELRERIITAATEAFTSKGIKSITMDDIAADRKSTRLNSSHKTESRMPSSA